MNMKRQFFLSTNPRRQFCCYFVDQQLHFHSSWVPLIDNILWKLTRVEVFCRSSGCTSTLFANNLEIIFETLVARLIGLKSDTLLTSDEVLCVPYSTG